MNSQVASRGHWFALLTLALFSLHANAAVGPLANQPYALGIIVKYHDDAASRGSSVLPHEALQAGDQQALAAAISAATGKEFRHHGDVPGGAQVYNLADWHTEQTLDAIAAQLMADSAVDYAETDRMLHPQQVPNDPRYSEQWHYFEALGGLNLPGAWSSQTGNGVVVAVLDTGHLTHADLVGNLVPGYDMISSPFVGNDGDGRDNNPIDPGDWSVAGECGPTSGARNSTWHGTHVTGTVAATAFNAYGVAGVAYNARVLSVRVLGKCGGSVSDIAAGMVWAAGGSVSGVPANANPAKVLNLSLGTINPATCSTAYTDAITAARDLGAVVIVAAGNSNDNADLYSPSGCPGTLSVAATSRSGGKASYSNFGSTVDVAAPGGDGGTGSPNAVLSALNDGTTVPAFNIFQFYNGTSMATPHVAGLAALMFEGAPNMTPDQVETIIENTARPFPGPCAQCGSGIADATAAVGALPPLNDNFAFAFNAIDASYTDTLLNAFVDGGTSGVGNAQPDVWYRYTAIGPGMLRVNTCGSRDLPTSLDTVVSIHSDTGDAGTAANQLALNDDFTGPGGDASAACPNVRDSAVALSVVGGQALLIRVSRYSSASNGDFILNIALELDPPPNDAFANAIGIGSGAYTGTLIGATLDGSTTGVGADQLDVWYSLSIPRAGTLRVNTCGSRLLSGLDSVLSLHADTGVAGTAANQLALNDDFAGAGGDSSAACSSSRDSAFAYVAANAEAVLIRVSRYSVTSNGAFHLNVSFVAAPPSNDTFSNATVIEPGQSQGTLIGATGDGSGGVGSTGLPDVWYAYTAVAAGSLQIDTCGSEALSGIDTALTIHSNTGVVGSPANQLAFNGNTILCSPVNGDAGVEMSVNAGDAILIRVTRTAASADGDFILNVALTVRPPNDDFANQIQLTVDGQYAGTLTAATNDGSGSAGAAGQPDVWYTYFATATGTVRIDTCGSQALSGLDTALTIHTNNGAIGTQANEIASNDDTSLCSPANGDSGVEFAMTASHGVLIRVTRSDATTDGDFVLNVSTTIAPPLNDGFADAINIGGSSQGTLLGATRDGASSADNAGFPDEADVWYGYAAPADGTLRVNTCGSLALSNINTVLSVHSDTGVAGTLANELAANVLWASSGGDPTANCPGTYDSSVAVALLDGDNVLIRVSRGDDVGGLEFILNVDFEVAAPDTDGDGIADNLDNCINAANTDQRDTDGDGIGNRCDADFNNDCIVNPIDLGLFRTVFFTPDPDADLNGDGIVNPIDLGLLRTLFFMPPGPSGLPNACSP